MNLNKISSKIIALVLAIYMVIGNMSIAGFGLKEVLAEEIRIQEPTTQMSVDLSNNNLSTLVTNKTTVTIKLNDTNSSCKLFSAGKLELTLPNNLVDAKIISAKSLYENGLKITNAKIENGKIIIDIDGKQTTYDTENISGGVNIVLDLELDIADTVPTHKETLELSYGEDKVSTEVNIVSKVGLLILSEVTGYDNESNITTAMDSNISKIEVAENELKKEVVQTLKLVNNYDETITQMQIIGRIGYSNEELVSTFDTRLTKPVEINKTNAKVYYSENKDASYEDESWQEEFSTNAKSYKIELNKSEMQKMDTTEINLYMELPQNIGYNQSTYIKTEANYNYKNQNENDSSIICMNTQIQELDKHNVRIQKDIVTKKGEIIPISLSISPSITGNYVHSKQLVTYKITLENNSNKDLNNVVLEDIIPENAIYTYQEIKQGNIADYIETVKDEKTKLKSWNIAKLKANETKEFEIMLTMADVEQEQEIINTINLQVEGQTDTVESKLALKPAMIETSLATKDEEMIDITYNKDDIIEYYVKVKNITSNKIKNIKVENSIPKYLEYQEGGLGKFDRFEGYKIEKQGNLDNNIFNYNIEELKPNEEKTIIIRCKVKKVENDYKADINNISNVYVADEIYQTNLKNIKTVQADFEMSLYVDTKGKEILTKNDTVKYTIKVKNIGKRPAMVEVQDYIPEEIEINKIEYNIKEKSSKTIVTSTQNVNLTNTIKEGETLVITITGTVKEIVVKEETELIINNIAKLIQGDYILESNNVTFKMKPEFKKEESIGEEEPDIPNKEPEDKPDNKPEDKPGEGDKGDDNENTEETKTYKISGVAWLDTNKNGQRNKEEPLLSKLKATLIDAKKGQIVKNEQDKDISVVTNENGEYEFNNLPEGKYLVMFEFDTSKYTATTYKRTGIYPTENSDAIISFVTINGEEKLVGITDNIQIEKGNKENIDIGLIENATFDLSLEKVISSITVTNTQGTKTTNYKNENFAKIDLVAKYMNNTNVIITYKFIIKNQGDVTGYVDKLEDNLPSGLEFSSELNKDWYKGNDGNLYTTSLNEIAIKPGETTEIELILTKKTTENTTGTFSNNAKLTQVSNIEAIEEKEPAKENNKSSADLVISIKTGTAVMYIGITLICILIIGAGAYIIKKKILNRGI